MIRPGIRRLFRLPIRRKDLTERDLSEEIRLHLDLRAEQLEQQGLSPEDAQAEARRRFGPAEEAHRTLQRAAQRREQRLQWREWLDGGRQDLRYAIRSLRKSPAVTAVIILTLALGIGLCTSIYSVVRGVILDPVPYPDPHQLLSVQLSRQSGSGKPLYRDYLAWNSERARDADVAAYAIGPRRIGYEQGTVEAFSVRVTDRFFGVLRARPLLGRTLVPSDASATSEPAAVISHRLWQNLLGSDSSAIGEPIRVGGRSYSLVGVLEPGQEFPAPVDLWTPLIPSPEEIASLHITVIGRLTPGSTKDEARVAFESLHRSQVVDQEPGEGAARVEILPLYGRENDAAGIVSLLLAISVGSILLIGVANAAGLIVTRALARDHEIAIRASLGASRLRIVALLLTEAVLVAVAAAGAGLLIAHLALEGFRRGIPETMSRQMLGWQQFGLDGNVVAFAVALAVVAGLGCGLIPAIGAARPRVTLALQQSSAAVTSGPRRSRLLRALVVGEVALSVVLLLCAALLSRSLLELVGTEPGFETDGIATIRWNVPDDASGGLLQLQKELLVRIAGIPGVLSVTLASDLPSTKAEFGATRSYEFQGPDSGRKRGRASWRVVSPGYLDMLRIPLLQGRAIAASDAVEAPRVAIVSESLARGYSRGGESVLGRQISVGGELWTVVGVTGDVQSVGRSTGSGAMIYVPQAQAPTGEGYLLVRVAPPLGAIARVLREEAWSVDPAIALSEVRTLRAVIDDLVADQRIVALLVAAYAATALVITLISLYAIVAHMVVRHRREYGLRAALGASPQQILRGAMRKAFGAALMGTLIGTLLGVGLGRLISRLLYGITPLEPSVFGVLPFLLLGIFAIAVYLPARAAAKVDPMTSLRV